MRTRNKIIIGIFVACLAVAAGIGMEVRTGRQMRAAVEQALEQNRHGIPFTSDTIVLASDTTQRIPLRRVAAYYNAPLRRFLSRHSSFFTLNSSLIKSLYALGCAYRDLHEAPIALLTWEDAIAAADTTSADCDYATLYRVYGQMAEVYFRQYMPEKQLEAGLKFCDYALIAGDTLYYIGGLLRLNDAYLSLGDTAAVFENIQHVRHLYLERGLKQEAAQVYPSAIHIALDRGEYAKADSMMQIYEKESGLFDEHGSIAPTREIYYYRKGIYFLGTNQPDSAEFQFRRLLNYEPNLVDANRGLLMLYQQKHDADSTFKYARLYEKALEYYLDDTHTDAITQAKGMYDYNRQQRLAQHQQSKARRRGWTIVIIILLAFSSFAFIALYFRRKRHKDQQALLAARNSYVEAKNELSKLQEEVCYLRKNLPTQKETDDLLKEKEALRQKLLSQIASSLLEMGVDSSYDKDEVGLMNSDIVQLFKQIANPHTVKENGKVWQESSRPFSDSEWDELVAAIRTYHYGLYCFITTKHKLPKQRFKVCILSRLYFSNQEMAVLMGTSYSNISNLRNKVAKSLLGIEDLSLLDELLPEI